MAFPMPPIPNIPIFFPSGFIPMKIPAFHRPVCNVQGEYKAVKMDTTAFFLPLPSRKILSD
jgi:hypothetical protein